MPYAVFLIRYHSVELHVFDALENALLNVGIRLFQLFDKHFGFLPF